VDVVRSWAYDYGLARFPLVAIVGLATYVPILVAELFEAPKPGLSRTLRRVPAKAHRRLAYAVILLASVHRLMG
jgi:hypothetical protein